MIELLRKLQQVLREKLSRDARQDLPDERPRESQDQPEEGLAALFGYKEDGWEGLTRDLQAAFPRLSEVRPTRLPIDQAQTLSDFESDVINVLAVTCRDRPEFLIDFLQGLSEGRKILDADPIHRGGELPHRPTQTGQPSPNVRGHPPVP